MTCDDIRSELVDFADGELPAERAREVAIHVESCPTCQATLGALRRSLRLAREVWRGSEQALQAGTGPKPRRMRLRRALPRVAAAFAVAAGLLLALLVWHRPQTAENASPPIVSRPADDEKRMIALLRDVGTRPDEYAYSLGDSRPASDSEAAIRREIERAGMGVQLLAAADLLAETPGGRDIACTQYEQIRGEYRNLAAEVDERLAQHCRGAQQ